jgi:hypothetical protein
MGFRVPSLPRRFCPLTTIHAHHYSWSPVASKYEWCFVILSCTTHSQWKPTRNTTQSPAAMTRCSPLPVRCRHARPAVTRHHSSTTFCPSAHHSDSMNLLAGSGITGALHVGHAHAAAASAADDAVMLMNLVGNSELGSDSAFADVFNNSAEFCGISIF